MLNSEFASKKRQVDYYDDLTKFATLAKLVLNGFGAKVRDIEDLIGQPPSIFEVKEEELPEAQKEWIAWAKKNGIRYSIINGKIKIQV